MNIFTANQVNQVYVASALKATSATLAKTDTLGTIRVGKNSVENAIYIQQVGAGGLVRSDLIKLDNILYGKATPASAMARKLKVAKVTLNSAALKSSKPVVGQDYILRIRFDQVMSLSPDSQYWKYGVVHAVDMSASDFYKKMALSIVGNMAREAVKLISVFLTTASDPVEVTPGATLSGTYTGILIKEVEQDWMLGVKQQRPVSFTVEPTLVTVDSVDVTWGDVIYNNGEKITGGAIPEKSIDTANAPATTTVGNGKLMADYEYFYMGERGDQYRMVNWPDYVPTKYLVDPTKTYDTIAIHYAYVGANHSVQKSEKDITILVPSDATVEVDNEDVSLTNVIISAINTAAGSTVVAALS